MNEQEDEETGSNEMWKSIIEGVEARVGVGVDEPCTAKADNAEDESWIGCLGPFAAASCILRRQRIEHRTQLAACPQGSILHRGQKCLYRCLRGRGRYHHSASSARTGTPVSSS